MSEYFDPQRLKSIISYRMPFGKYAGRPLIDLPEEYLLWLNKNEMPKGQLGELLTLTLEIKVNGLESLLTPLRKS